MTMERIVAPRVAHAASAAVTKVGLDQGRDSPMFKNFS
jgi:hypothetical protein